MYLAQIRQIAQEETTSPKILALLAQSQDYYVRKNIAANPNTPTEILLVICREFPDEVMNNPVIPLLFLESPDLLTCEFTINFPQLKYFINLEINRLNWCSCDRRYLDRQYEALNKSELTLEQQYDFLCYLKML